LDSGYTYNSDSFESDTPIVHEVPIKSKSSGGGTTTTTTTATTRKVGSVSQEESQSLLPNFEDLPDINIMPVQFTFEDFGRLLPLCSEVTRNCLNFQIPIMGPSWLKYTVNLASFFDLTNICSAQGIRIGIDVNSDEAPKGVADATTESTSATTTEGEDNQENTSGNQRAKVQKAKTQKKKRPAPKKITLTTEKADRETEIELLNFDSLFSVHRQQLDGSGKVKRESDFVLLGNLCEDFAHQTGKRMVEMFDNMSGEDKLVKYSKTCGSKHRESYAVSYSIPHGDKNTICIESKTASTHIVMFFHEMENGKASSAKATGLYGKSEALACGLGAFAENPCMRLLRKIMDWATDFVQKSACTRLLVQHFQSNNNQIQYLAIKKPKSVEPKSVEPKSVEPKSIEPKVSNSKKRKQESDESSDSSSGSEKEEMPKKRVTKGLESNQNGASKSDNVPKSFSLPRVSKK